MRAGLLVLALLVAGCARPVPTPDVEVPPAPGLADLAWRAYAGAPRPRTEVAVAVVGERILVAGGFDARGRASDAVEIFDTSTGSWVAGPSLPVPVHHAMAATLDGAAHVFGGFGGDGIARAEAYQLGADGWERIPDMPVARGAGAAAGTTRGIVVAGGVDARGALTPTAVLFDGSAWSPLLDLPRPRDHLAAASLDGNVYFVGGRILGWDENRAWLDRLDEDAWEALPDMPTPRGGLAAAAWRGNIVALGGEEAAGTFEEVEAWNGTAWVGLPDLPTPRHGLGAAVVGARLYALLGGERPGLSTSGAVASLA